MTWRVIQADAMEGLRSLPDESVHCCVTSPPYWGLRDYGTGAWDGGDPGCAHRVGGQVEDGKAPGAITAGVRPGVDASRCLDCGAARVDRQLGLEPTPEEYVARMVEVFREVRRVLREDGTLWLNLGDSYNAYNGNAGPSSGFSAGSAADTQRPKLATGHGLRTKGLKPKDLVGIPWRVAFALQADGWYLRSEIIWAKPNPMPESVRDRPTKAHETVFLLAKSPRYYFDAEAVREPSTGVNDHDLTGPGYDAPGQAPQRGSRPSKKPDGWATHAGAHGSFHRDGRERGGASEIRAGRNIRSVWTMATKPFPEAHFATFPPELPRRCILAGTSERGCCPECGAPWERVIEEGELVSSRLPNANSEWKEPGDSAVRVEHDRESRRGIDGITINKTSGWSHLPRRERATVCWRPTCDCIDEVATGQSLGPDVSPEPVPCTVLDPFAGSGTTGLVALQLGRSFVGIELSPEYAAMAEKRIGGACVETVSAKGGKLAPILGPLFEPDIRDVNHQALEATRRGIGE